MKTTTEPAAQLSRRQIQLIAHLVQCTTVAATARMLKDKHTDETASLLFLDALDELKIDMDDMIGAHHKNLSIAAKLADMHKTLRAAKLDAKIDEHV